MFDTEEEAAQYCKPDARTSVTEWYVVWAGRTTGVMSQEDCLKATKSFQNAVVEGPLSRADADKAWDVTSSDGSGTNPINLAGSYSGAARSAGPKAETSSAAAAVDTAASTIKDKPTEQEFEEALAANKTEVFVCVQAARIALSWEAAARDLKNPSVRVVNDSSDLFINYACAERTLKESVQTPKQLSVAERIAAARVKIQSSAASPAKAAAAKKQEVAVSSKAASAAQSASSTSGQSTGIRVGSVGVVRTREISHIMRCFVDADKSIEIKPSPSEPKSAQLAEQMPAPGATTYLHSTRHWVKI